MIKTENIIIRVSEELKNRAKQEAEREGKSLSEYILDLVKIDLAKKEK